MPSSEEDLAFWFTNAGMRKVEHVDVVLKA